MIYEVFAIYDKAVKNYMVPQFEQTKEVAIRNFKVAMNRQDLFLYMQPEDFTLYHLGEYDSKTGEIKLSKPELVCDGLSVLDTSNDDKFRRSIRSEIQNKI